MRKILVFLILALLFCMPVHAQNDYEKQYENIGADSIKNGIDEQTRSFLQQNDIDVKDSNWVNKITQEGVFSHVFEFITSGIKTPIKTGVLITSVIFLSAALTAFGTQTRFETAIYAAVLSISVLISGSIWNSVSAAVNAAKGCSTFMTSFVPVFAGVLALSGKTVTAPAMSVLLLGAAESTSLILSFVVLPLMGGYLALSISAGVSPLINGSGIVNGIKKISIWIISLISTLFVGVLGIQTVVNSAADGVALRTAKFILGTSVPIAGTVLSEAVSTITASMGLLRASIGIYGVVVLALMLLPIVVELLIWRAVITINAAIGEFFSLPKITGVLRSVDAMLSLLIAVILVVGGMFIISLTVVVTVSKG